MSDHGRKSLIISILAIASVAGAAVRAAEPSAEDVEFFERHIRPILVVQCYDCHSAKAKKLKGGLMLDSRAGVLAGGDTGPALVPGKVDKSLLIEAVRWSDSDTRMPPKTKLSERDIKLLERWVAMGAPDPRRGGQAGPIKREINIEEGRRWWAFARPEPVAPPKVKDADWPRTSIDRFVHATHESNELSPVGDADRETLIRRVYFDLIGLPPTPQQVDRFLADRSEGALAKVVDELLASPRFGERWGRHWMDVARYAESTGMERNFSFPHAWRYRDYVIDAFNSDKPFDRFVREQLAGDLIESLPGQSDTERVVATGFLALGPKSLNERDKDLFRMDVVDEQIDVTTRAVLGLTVSCARCHDHKFDPVPQEDYYALAGIFTSSQTYYGTAKGNGNRQAGELMPIGADAEQRVEAIRAYRKRVAQLNKELGNAKKKLKQLQKQKKNLADRDEASKLERVQSQMAEMKSKVSKLDDKMDDMKKNEPPAPEYAMAVGEGDKPADCRLHIRGNTDTLGDPVERGYLQVIPASHPSLSIGDETSGRAELARWMTDAEHGAGHLAARVIVNRVWHHLFGRGIVRTVDNFGATGAAPSDRRLLDHLAVTFIDDGWSVKKLIRRVTLSRVYGLSSEHDAANHATDPENRYFWKANRRRLDAESIRDAVLSAAGALDVTPVERSVVAGINSNVGRNRRDFDKLHADTDHRSVYLPIVRNAVPEMLQVFDFAEPSMIVGARDATTVPTQALFMMNSPFVLKRSKQMADRLLDESGFDDAGRVTLAYRLTLGRMPSASERDRALRFIDETAKELGDKDARATAWASFCQALFASAEFRYVN